MISRIAARFRVARAADPLELEQAKIRLANGVVIASYFVLAFLWDGEIDAAERWSLVWIGCYYLLGGAILGWIALQPRVSWPRRWAGAVLDMGGNCLIMVRTEEVGAVMYGMFLWVVLGNGFRFGRRYMHGVQALAIIGFAAVLFMSDYWRRNETLGIGLLLALIAVPWYVSQLLSRLQQARAEAVAANVAKTKFLAAASHDLRQPMQALSMYTSVLRGASDAVARRVLRGIELSVATLEQLFDSLLDISKIESGVIRPEVRAVELAPLLERVVQSEMPLAAQKNLELRVVRTAAAVRTDPALLERMLRNLVTNAVRYTERGGVVVGCRRQGAGRLRLEVVDSGIGIAREERQRIFDEYYQLSGKSAQGLGLGLPIVKSLGELLGHAVAVRSALGKGSVFSIELQRAPAAEVATEAPATAQDGLSGMNVAVVDDDVEIRDSVRLLLERWGCRVVAGATVMEVASGLHAERLQPDAFIVDHRLADAADGLQAIAELRVRFGQRLPALIITGTANILAESERADVPIAMKPVAPGKLRAFLSQARRQRVA
jgi:signal transduction histidine kinase/CheY-like chemotaxis protein